MAGFYALLKQSILDRGITDSGERDEIYAQARQAMIRRLWEIQPPLAEDEIEQRIGAFDVAVSDIEGDIMATLAAEEPEPEPVPPPPRARPALPALRDNRQPAYAPAYPRENGYARQRDYGTQRAYADDHDYADEPAYRDTRAQVPALPAYSNYDRDYARGEPDEYAYEEEAQRIDAYADDDEAYDDRYDDEAVVVPAAPPPRAKLPRPPPRQRRRDGSYDDYDQQAYAAPRAREEAELVRRRSRKKGFLQEALAAIHLSESDKIRMLASAIGLCVIVLIGGAVYFLLPHGGDDGVTVDIGVRREVSDAATAVRVAEQQVPIDQTFMLFDGRDPTVFETSTDNPVRFNAQSGIVRVSSSATSPGVKVLIGPGLAARLAGREVRVTIVARSSPEAGAATMRFAYQSGVAISYWQTANLGSDFQSVAMIWRVPSLRTDRAGDLLIVQPGVPGDGTGADIKSIRIDLLPAQG